MEEEFCFGNFGVVGEEGPIGGQDWMPAPYFMLRYVVF